MFSNCQPQHEEVVLPFRCGTPCHPVRIVFLHKAIHIQGKSIAPNSGDFYYLAVRKLMKQVRRSITVQQARSRYEKAAPAYARTLISGLSTVEYDAVAAIPTSEEGIQAPYLHAVRESRPDVLDLSPHLIRTASSTDDVSCEERLEGSIFRPPADMPKARSVLLLDDVIDSGISAAAAIRAIERAWNDESLQFALCCPLWIVHQR